MDVRFTLKKKDRSNGKLGFSALYRAGFSLLFGFFIGSAKISFGFLPNSTVPADIRPFGTAYMIVCFLNFHSDMSVFSVNPYSAMAGIFASLTLDVRNMQSIGFSFSSVAAICGVLSILDASRIRIKRFTAMGVSAIIYTILIFTFKLNMPLSAINSLIELALLCLLVIIFDDAVKVFLIKRKTVWTDEECISVIFFLVCVIIGFGRLHFLKNKLINVASAMLCLFFSSYGGSAIGSATAVLCGFAGLLCESDYQSIGLYTAISAISSVASGIFNKKSKLIFIASYFISTTFLFVILSFETAKYSIIENCIATISYFFIPDNVLVRLSKYVDANLMRESEQSIHSKRFRELTVGRLKEISSVFASAGKLFTEEKKEHKISYMLSAVPEQACNGCMFFDSCWDRGFEDSYALMQLLFEKYEQTGIISKEDLGDDMEAKCIRIQKLLSVCKEVFNKYIENSNVEKRIIKSRKAVGEQMYGISKVISSISGDVNMDVRFHDEYEASIRDELRHIDIGSVEVCVEFSFGMIRAFIKLKDNVSENDKYHKIRDAVSRGCKKEMSYVPSESTSETICYEQLREYRLLCGVATAKKNGSDASGDTYSFEKLRDGRQMLLLCDGMGSGRKAARESTQAVSLVEDFYRAGFDEESILSAINRLLILSSSDEIFSTMDMCMVKLTDGMAHFTKIGAPHSYLIRDGYAKKLSAASLPIGILDEFVPSFHDIQLKNGDVIVMFSDGIADLENANGKMFSVITDAVELRNPNEIASEIIQGALNLSSGNAKDDMTVIVARVQKLNHKNIAA